ncbi:MAG: FtsX-like permease family protein, partial [Candidatus Acidiferrales bacterium]
LLVGGGLLVRSFVRLMQVSPGFNAENLLTLRVQLPDQKYPKPENAQALFRDLLGRIKNLPGVESTGAISFLPMAGAMYNLQFNLDGQPPAPGSKPTSAEYRVVTPEYFRAMGIPLLRGRTFTEADSPDSPPVAIINEEMARRFWPNTDPIGQRIAITDRPIAIREIVGIVGDVKQFGLDRPARPEMYITEFQKGWGNLAVVVRSKTPPSSLASAVAAQVEALDKDLPVYRVETMEEIITRSVGDRRFSTYLFTLFASLALILATVGIYGVMSYTVAQGTREIGIRMALGAKRADVLRLVLGMGMRGVLLGVGLGIGGAVLLTRYLASLLFSVNPIDPATFTAVAILLSVVAFAACYIPARRAMRVDPMVALRYE